jgi:hypothetical protein
MRKLYIPIALAMILCMASAGPSWANSELHPGGRLFFPLWDVSSPNRVTFIIVTRDALTEDQAINGVIVPTAGGATFKSVWTLSGVGNCLPRGALGSEDDVNRTDLGGTAEAPIFVDDVHFEYYGRGCSSANEVVHMSCADIDLFLLTSPDNSSRKPRKAFAAVAGQGRGALDVHLITNSLGGRKERKLENSLMGHAIISDLAEGWAAVYPAAAAKATSCPRCESIDGTPVGYENYPMEVSLPWAFADLFPAPGGALRNLLSLWAPGLFPGANLSDTSIGVAIKWWDGRERPFGGGASDHAIVRPLGGPPLPGVDPPIAGEMFSVAGFVCGHDATGVRAENDGFPRTGSDAVACGVPDLSDPAHPSDNFEVSGAVTDAGHSIQGSRPIGWWRFQLSQDGRSPRGIGVHSGRGLVGVLLSATAGTQLVGVGDATRLWHKDACELAQSERSFGPPHLRDGGVWANSGGGFTSADLISLFNIFDLDDQARICAGRFTDG